MKRRALNVGCGKDRIDPRICDPREWDETRVDIDPAVKPDIVASATDMRAVKSGSFDLVYNSHNLEHVYAHEVPLILREFRRVLKKGGEVVITCPDLQQIANFIAEGNLEGFLYMSHDGPISPIDIVYGHRAFLVRGNEFYTHKTGFTDTTLAAKLKDAGFKNVSVARVADDFALWACATK